MHKFINFKLSKKFVRTYKLAMQVKCNETIRAAYSFYKYTERIKECGPDALAIHLDAKVKWLQAILDSNTLPEEDCDPSRIVDFNTIMRHSTYTEHCAQGPTVREKWLFPWEEAEEAEKE